MVDRIYAHDPGLSKTRHRGSPCRVDVGYGEIDVDQDRMESSGSLSLLGYGSRMLDRILLLDEHLDPTTVDHGLVE